MALALPPLVLGLFALSSAYRIHASNQAVAAEKQFPQMAPPTRTQRILVFAPHCDDETLGAAGLMRQAERAGTPVHVVIFSNGDGFRVGVQRDFHELRVPPADFVRYAGLRQTESQNALARLGVPKDSITFLGFPDRGLLPLWTTNWATPFPSAFTGTDHCPYPNSPLYKSTYTGQTLLNAVMAQMRRARPTDVFVTHPADDHPDHAAASAFVQAALAQCRAAGDAWAQTTTLHFYLVHRGDWPVPQGLDEGMPLPPPAPMMGLDTRWTQLPLSADDTRAKFAAICRYKSQTELTGRFLYSFARTTELFGTLGQDGTVALPRVPDGRMTLLDKNWAGLSPVAMDAAGDTVLRAFQASADVSRLWACRDSRYLYLRLDTRQTLSPQVTYQLLLRPLAPGTSPAPDFVRLSVIPRGPGEPHPVNGTLWAWHGNELQARVPLAQAGLSSAADTLYLGAETRFAGVAIDKTGFRGLFASTLNTSARTASR